MKKSHSNANNNVARIDCQIFMQTAERNVCGGGKSDVSSNVCPLNSLLPPSCR